MTLHCWMHWFWITLCTLIAVLPNCGVCLPFSANANVSLDSVLPQLPSTGTTVRNLRPNVRSEASVQEKIRNSGLELSEVISAAVSPPLSESGDTVNKSKTVYATLNSNKSKAKDRDLSYNQETATRNRETGRLVAGTSFPVPNVDDSGDTEGALQLGPIAANVDLQSDAGRILVSRLEETTAVQQKELDLRYNAVVSDGSHKNPKATEVNEGSETPTTVATGHELQEQTPNITDNSMTTVTDINNIGTLDSNNNSSENITRLEDLGLVPDDSTEEVLSRSSLTIQERREQLGNSLNQAANDAVFESGMDPGAIAGISLGVLAIATLASAASFVLYRTRYLNNPQTLSDKCSNPDSSGYIDDSTMRENSEEMYSLDNDSFLNSLEAMTIQNYWTDSVKHTKL